MSLKFNRLILIAIFLVTPFMMSCYAPINDPFEMDRYLLSYNDFLESSELIINPATESDVNAIEDNATYKIFVVPMNYESKGSYIVIYNAVEYPNVKTLADLANVKEAYWNMSYLYPDNNTISGGAGGTTSICVGVEDIVLTEETITKGMKIDNTNRNHWYLYYNNSWWRWSAVNNTSINWGDLYPDPLAVN